MRVDHKQSLTLSFDPIANSYVPNLSTTHAIPTSAPTFGHFQQQARFY